MTLIFEVWTEKGFLKEWFWESGFKVSYPNQHNHNKKVVWKSVKLYTGDWPIKMYKNQKIDKWSSFTPLLTLVTLTSKWAILFKTHTPPVEDFGKVYFIESGNFQMHLPSVGFLYYSSQREYILCSEGPNKLINLKFTPPLYEWFLKSSTGVCGIQME